jgi:RNA-directed DNA polymerase
MKEINRRIRSWRIQLKSDKTLLDFSRIFNPILRGWHAYFGRFYPSALGKIWDHFNRYSPVLRVHIGICSSTGVLEYFRAV